MPSEPDFLDDLDTVDNANEMDNLDAIDNYKAPSLSFADLKATILRHKGSKALRLHGLNIKALPPEIGLLRSLELLDLRGNCLEELPVELLELTKLEELYISNNNLTRINFRMECFERLVRLDASRNSIQQIPLGIDGLKGLKELDLSHNCISELPSDLGRLTSLELLDVSHNRISVLPPSLSHIRNLRVVDLSHNQITAIPALLGNLSNLRGINLANNRVESLPEEIGQLIKLETFELSRNCIEQLPSSFGQLRALKELYLEGNRLTSLPFEMGHLGRLKRLDVDSNPIETPPPEVTDQGTSAIISFLHAHLKGSVRQWVSKLILLGEGGAGKTSLLRAIRGLDLSHEERSTRGIDISGLDVPHPERASISMRLRCWDFGGQEIYHATHQFFLTNRSLFLLVWNSRLGFEQGRLYYWLDTIQALAPDSPVMLVSTWIDERHSDLPLQELKKRYPQVIGNWPVSNLTKAGIEELVSDIAHCAAELPLMGERWPERWLEAAGKIKRINRTWVSPENLSKLLGECGIEGSSRRVLLKWLHELGEILFFDEREGLNDIIMLKPDWVTKKISQILESQQVIKEHGVLTKSAMDEIWSDLSPTLRSHFLRLMEQFDLSYQILENNDVSIVVERLSFEPPAYEKLWTGLTTNIGTREVSLKYQFLSTIPAGLPTWFIARMHRFTTYTHWRNGALLADEKKQNYALIEAVPHDRYIRLSARGRQPQLFFAILRDGLEFTIDRFPGLKMERLIPCPGHNGTECHHEFDLTHIESALQRVPPVLHLQCPEALENVPLLGMLYGVEAEVDRMLSTRLANIEKLSEETFTLVQQGFVRIFKSEQNKPEIQCPNAFILRHDDASGLIQTLRGLHGSTLSDDLIRKIVRRLELHLCCQAPGEWHPTGGGGRYKLNIPTSALTRLAPLVKRIGILAKCIVPVSGSIDALTDVTNIKLNIEFTSELARLLPTSLPFAPSDLFTGDDEFKKIAGSQLRELRKILEVLDPSDTWGGLERIVTPEGTILWLCPTHATKYRYR